MKGARLTNALILIPILLLPFLLGCPDAPFRIDNGKIWDFEGGDPDNGRWEAVHSISNLRVQNGVLAGDITGHDPHLHGPPALRALAELNTAVELRMKIDAGTTGTLYWTTSSDPVWGGSKARSFDLVSDNQWHTYTIQFQRSRDWIGFITQIRIDPNDSDHGQFEIDHVRFIGAPLSYNNIQYYGYYHVEDNRFGRHMHDVADYNNFVHLTWSSAALEDFRATVVEAAGLGLKVIPELSNVFLFHAESEWASFLDDFADDVAGLEHALLCIYLIDEPYIHANPVDKAKQERAVALTKTYFPGIPHVINYTGEAGLNAPAANLDWIAFDAYSRENVRKYHPYYTGFEKPTLMIGKSYSNGPPNAIEALELRLLDAFTYDKVREYDEVVGLWWFMYGNVADPVMSGAVSYPDLLADHREIAGELFGD